MIIKINTRANTIKTDRSWQMCMSADHAFQMHRTDMCDQIKLAHDEIGFQYLRFHGIFNDDMCTYQTIKEIAPGMPGGHKIKEINFRQIGHIYDNLLERGVKPFVELSFMPKELASGKKTGLKYLNNITPPADYDKWAEYIKSFIKFLLHRYGKEEVETWFFEVWNEPDLRIFFTGKKQEYYRLYEVTARAVKSVDKNLRVGGPSTSACKWVADFISYCEKNQIPLDFVTTHHYPGDAFGNLITPWDYFGIFKKILKCAKQGASIGDTMTEMFFSPEKAAQVPKGAISVMDDELRINAGKYPVYVSEWNSMAIFAVPVHDEKYSAAFILKTVLDLNNKLDGYSFWCLSDIYEESIQLNKPFFGGYGIITVDGIPKPNFWAFKILSKLYDKRLDVAFRTNELVEYAAFTDGENLQVVVYAQSNDYCEKQSYNYIIELNYEYSHVTVQTIDDIHCNPKVEWINMGSPDNLTRAEVRQIKKETQLVEEEIAFDEGSKATVSGNLRTNDIKLYTFYKQREGGA